MRSVQQASTVARREAARSVGRRWSLRLARGALAAALLLGTTSLTAPIAAAQSAATPAAQPAAQFPRMVTVDQITDNPGAYYGVAVTLVGDVEDVLGPRAFTVEDQDILLDEELLVVSGRPFAAQPDGSIEADMLRSESLMISGTVHQFNEAAFEQQLGMDLDDGQFAAWAGRPAIIADSIIPARSGVQRRPPMATAPGTGDLDPAVQGESSGEATGGDLQSNTGIDAILNAPESYVGQTTTVSGRVDEIVGTRSFVLTDPDAEGEQLLVVSALSLLGVFAGADVPTPGDGQTVEVTGEVWRFDLGAVEQRIGIDLADPEFTEWAGRPVMIATAIAPATR